ncbi:MULTISPECIES: hypothetical protein [unclassified Pseudomonas]|uniref:hypothetical protein n=1 Tax=unclassified Pseudomonas TaxID=196821 RepID=UPI0012DCDE12|nr:MULTISPECIES: hypothetical protein [unclassified Pseudomonas]
MTDTKLIASRFDHLNQNQLRLAPQWRNFPAGSNSAAAVAISLHGALETRDMH